MANALFLFFVFRTIYSISNILFCICIIESKSDRSNLQFEENVSYGTNLLKCTGGALRFMPTLKQKTIC